MTPAELLAALQLGEDQEVEFKSAAGGLPKSLWETLSAFANTAGGWLVLGVVEHGGGFEAEGLRKPQALLKSFWDNHNNVQKLSFPVCREQDVTLLAVGEAQVLSIWVPRAPRQRVQKRRAVTGVAARQDVRRVGGPEQDPLAP